MKIEKKSPEIPPPPPDTYNLLDLTYEELNAIRQALHALRYSSSVSATVHGTMAIKLHRQIYEAMTNMSFNH